MVKLNVKAIRDMMRDKAKTAPELAYESGFSPILLDVFLKDGKAPVEYAKGIARALGVPIITITTA